MFVFDGSRKATFASMGNWLMECQQYTGKEVVKLLVCNKCDLERTVTKEEVERFAQAHDIEVIETSAKTGDGVNEAFMYLVNKTIEKMPSTDYSSSKESTVDFSASSSHKKCC